MDQSKRNKPYSFPLNLWWQIETIIRKNNEQEFEQLCNDEDRAPHMARVLLSQYLPNEVSLSTTSNNNSKYHTLQLSSTLQPQHYVQQLFGPSCQDLNPLQMTLFLRHDAMAISMLVFLQHHVSRTDLVKFVNHPWGYENSSLHLAAFLGMEKLVQRLLECGADVTHRNTRQYGPLDGCTKPACIQLLQQSLFDSPASTTINNNNDHFNLPRTSMFLKKAVQQSLIRKDNDMTILPLLLSSTSSSTSSYSSLSSLEEPLSPSHSSQISDYRYWISSSPSSPPLPSPSPSKSPSRQYSTNNRRINKLIPSHMNQPKQISYQHRLRSPPPPPSSSSDNHNDNEIVKNNNCSTTIVNSSVTESKTILSSDQPTRPSKSVRFSPESILLDSCMRGDIEDLMDLIKQQQQQQQHSKPVRTLLQEWQDLQTIPILSLALLYQQEPMAKYLLSLGVDVNATDPDGWTPLHYAATFQLWPSVVSLAHHPGIHLEARTNNGLKVYDCPRAKADQRRCKVLIDRAKKRQQK